MKAEKLSSILKTFAKIIGCFCIAYGFIIGVIGAGPDGLHKSPTFRIVGLYIIVLGVMYFYPNSKLAGNRKKVVGYLIFTSHL